MLLNKTIKSSYTAKEVAAARAKLDEINYLSKPLIALNEENKEIILTVLIGENDEYGLAPIVQQINSLIAEYHSIPFAKGLDKTRPPSTEMKLKAAIAKKLIDLNKALDEKLPAEIYAKHATKFNTATAFYPSPSFISIKGKGEFPIINDETSMKHSAVLSSTTLKGYGKIAVTPPASHAVYSYLAETYSTMFLIHCMKASSPGTWSKYTNGRSLPSGVNWGLMLLALGIHPLYKVKHRTNIKEVASSPLFQDILPNWVENFDFALWEKLAKTDLKPHPNAKGPAPVHTQIDLAAERKMFKNNIRDWYNKGNVYKNYATADDLIKKLDDWYDRLKSNASLSKDINKVILDMVSMNAFSQTSTRHYIIAYSIDHKMPDNLDQLIFDNSVIASFLHIEGNPSPNTYIALRHLTNPTGEISTLSGYAGISTETWVRYEQGTRIPHNSAWTSILLALDLHPIYKLIPRTDENEIEVMKQIYLQLHHSIHKPDSIEFYIQ